MVEESSVRLTLIKAIGHAGQTAGKPSRKMAGERFGKYKMKGSTGVTENDGSKDGLRLRAQGTRKLIAQSEKKIEANTKRRSNLIGQRQRT